MALELLKLSTYELLNLPREQTVFLLPVSPLEDHGAHLPIGTHLIRSEQLARRLSEKIESELQGWNAVLCPSMALGVDTNTTHLAFPVRGFAVRDSLVDTCESLIRHGFQNFIFVSGHLGPKHLTALEDAGRLVRRRYRRRFLSRIFGKNRIPLIVSASSALVNRKEALASPLWPDPFEHGGEVATSHILLHNPSLLKKELTDLAEIRRPSGRLKRFWQRFKKSRQGYWGTPASARPETADQRIKDEVEEIFIKFRAALEGSNPDVLFRSWYAAFPANGTFFHAWVLTFFLFGLLLIWAALLLP